ncbi:hypothetical protein L6307_01405 [Candidatus Parcubacteria bacterium]|nr:hypothetical protein [Patescibacteria group bacterium]MCG2697735.1 hypothetical protein [Candidatus Parcubacteria bacterium]
MTNKKNNESLILDTKQINGVEYQILSTKNSLNDICCMIIKITGQQNFEIGQFKNIETAKETLKELNGDDNIGKKVKIKIKNHDKVYKGKVVLWTYGENSRIEICGGEESMNEKVHLIFYKYDDMGNKLIEDCEFVD